MSIPLPSCLCSCVWEKVPSGHVELPSMGYFLNFGLLSHLWTLSTPSPLVQMYWSLCTLKMPPLCLRLPQSIALSLTTKLTHPSSLTLLSPRSPMVFLEDTSHFLPSWTFLKQEAPLTKQVCIVMRKWLLLDPFPSLLLLLLSLLCCYLCCLKNWFSKGLPSFPFKLYLESPWVVLYPWP